MIILSYIWKLIAFVNVINEKWLHQLIQICTTSFRYLKTCLLLFPYFAHFYIYFYFQTEILIFIIFSFYRLSGPNLSHLLSKSLQVLVVYATHVSDRRMLFCKERKNYSRLSPNVLLIVILVYKTTGVRWLPPWRGWTR